MSYEYFLQNVNYRDTTRNCDDFFFKKGDLDKMEHFRPLIQMVKLCNDKYYKFNGINYLWEEKPKDTIIFYICDLAITILQPEKDFVIKHLEDLILPYKSKQPKQITEEDKDKLKEIEKASKEFKKFIVKCMDYHQKTSFAKSVLEFFNHYVSDNKFMEKINVNNPNHLKQFLKQHSLNLEGYDLKSLT